jgi:integrase
LEFHILTAARPGMVENMRLEHIDWLNAQWIVPAGYMKMGVEHIVPLSPRAMEILRDLKHTARKGYVFWGQRRGVKISNSTLKALMTRMGSGGFTPHGFRSSFRDWAGDETLHDEETAEHALAHQVGSETRRAYRRGTALKKRRRLLEDWAIYLG